MDFQAEAVFCAVDVNGQIGFGDCLASRRINLGEPGAGEIGGPYLSLSFPPA